MKEFINSEISIINNLFRHNKIMARVIKAENVLNSFIRYHLSLHASQQFTAIEKIQRELSAALAKNRQKYRYPTTEIISVTKPNFGLEVSHPDPKPLLWSMRKATNLEPDTMLAGISAIDNKPELIRFKDLPHTLIAGMTNAGKSVLLQMMLLSLAANTKPSDLQFILIDLKNEDLLPLKKLPHVMEFCYDQQSAKDAIDWMLEEKTRRVEHNNSQRIVLVIDEIAQLASDKAVSRKLGDLVSIGRSKRLNLIAATQSVTQDGGIGNMMKNNFNCRLIGKVAPGMSSIATGLPKMYAHMLPGKGSFLRIEGSDNHRFQSYFIEPNDVTLLANHIRFQNNQVVPSSSKNGSSTGFESQNQQFHTSERETVLQNSSTEPLNFPIGIVRDLNDQEKLKVKELHQLGLSLNKLSFEVFGFKNGKTYEILKEVINVPIMA